MIKPILKIELPNGVSKDEFQEVNADLKKSTAAEEYHIIIIVGDSDYVKIEIITAPDASIHKP